MSVFKPCTDPECDGEMSMGGTIGESWYRCTTCGRREVRAPAGGPASCHVCDDLVNPVDPDSRLWRGVYFHDACLAWHLGDEDAPQERPGRAPAGP